MSADAYKAFDNISYLLMIKALKQPEGGWE